MAARETIIKDLISTLHDTLRFFDESVAVLNKNYAPGKWSMREILIHLSDCETVHLDRLRRLAAENNPMLMAFDQDRWASALLYQRRDLSLARAQYEAGRRQVMELARILAPEIDSRVGTHSEAGTRSFGWVLEHVAIHNTHHLDQIRAIKEGRTWSK